MERGLVVVLFGLFLFGCRADGDEHPSGASGRAMFGRYCAACHGHDGAGSFLKGVPPSRSTSLSTKQIADRILGLGADHRRRMPAFPNLSRSEALAIALYVRALHEASGGEGVFWEVGVEPPVPDGPGPEAGASGR